MQFDSADTRPSRPIAGGLLVTAAMALFAAMGVCIKLAAAGATFMQITLMRGLVGAVMIGAYARWRRIPLGGRRKGLLVLRAVSGTLALWMVIYAFTTIPVATAMLLNQATPLFMVPLAVVFLRERTSWKHVVWIAVAVAGVALVLRPDAGSVSIGGLWALLSAFFTAVAYMLVRKLTATENSWTIVFWFVAVSSLLTLPACLPWRPLDAATWGYLIAAGVLGTVGQMALTAGYRLSAAGKLAVLGSLGAVFAAVGDWLVFSHVPDALTAIGALIVLAACTAIQYLRLESAKL